MTAALIDTHCHLTHGRLRCQLAGVLSRANNAGLSAVITVGSSVADSAAASVVARQYESVFFTAGVHPHEAKDAAEDYLECVEELSRHPANAGVGEIGLDYHYEHSPREVQREVFAAQLALARRLGKPVVVHSREAFADTLAVLAESGIDGRAVVFHSFAEPPALARRALDFGAMIGFSGIVTFRNAAEVRASAALAPDQRLLIETDAPFLSPEPVRRDKTNEPANVRHVAACLAELRRAAAAEIAERTAANAVGFFRLTLPED